APPASATPPSCCVELLRFLSLRCCSLDREPNSSASPGLLCCSSLLLASEQRHWRLDGAQRSSNGEACEEQRRHRGRGGGGIAEVGAPGDGRGGQAERAKGRDRGDAVRVHQGGGPNSKLVEGFLYKYEKGEEVRIVCFCHKHFLSPVGFVRHASGDDIAHPLRHIIVNPSP
ncbi:hypothetical protein Taro_033408, partial [Colocasia esculenta]|nr:hypothetical protein [Colocasia esculenta]